MFSVFEQVGLRPGVPSGQAGGGLATATERVAVDLGDDMRWYSPRNPLVWLGGVLAVTVGLASVAGSVRLGKAKVTATVGSG